MLANDVDDGDDGDDGDDDGDGYCYCYDFVVVDDSYCDVSYSCDDD